MAKARDVPGLNGWVNALSASPTRLYAGGQFSTAAGSARTRLAAFSLEPATAGQLDGAWKPSASGAVLGVTYSPDLGRVYVGGSFTALNGNAATAQTCVTTGAGTSSQSVGTSLGQVVSVPAGPAVTATFSWF